MVFIDKKKLAKKVKIVRFLAKKRQFLLMSAKQNHDKTSAEIYRSPSIFIKNGCIRKIDPKKA